MNILFFNKMKDLTKYDFFILLLIIFWDLKKKKIEFYFDR